MGLSIPACQVGQIGTAGLRHAQGVEREQAGECVVVAARQPGLDEDAPNSDRSSPSRVDSWETFGRRTCTAGECSRSCSSTQ